MKTVFLIFWSICSLKGLKKETQTYSAVGKPSSSKVLFTFDIYGNVLTRELHTQNKLGEWSVFNRTTYTYEPTDLKEGDQLILRVTAVNADGVESDGIRTITWIE